MDRAELNLALGALTRTLNYYGKELDEDSASFWQHWLRDQQLEPVKAALVEHVKQSTYAPRIASLEKIMAEARERSGPRYATDLMLAQPTSQEAPPHVARAWSYAIRQWGGVASGMFADTKLSEQEIEDAIILVNQQVKASGNWDAIPPHLWMESLHGKPYPGGVAWKRRIAL